MLLSKRGDDSGLNNCNVATSLSQTCRKTFKIETAAQFLGGSVHVVKVEKL